MRKVIRRGLFAALLLLAVAVAAQAGVTVDPLLRQQVEADPLGTTLAVITFDHQPTSADLTGLQALGISGGIVLNQLPMVLTAINQGQFNALASRSDVVSLYANRFFPLSTNVSRTFIGVTDLQRDAEVTQRNGGLPISGNGVGVAVVDTGIDATHPDLELGQNVVQNVLFPLTEISTAPHGCVLNVAFNFGFLPPVFLEDQPISDAEGGHGTFVSGVIGGTGEASGAFYGGVAPGAGLVGLVAGNDCGLPTFGIVQAFDYALVHQIEHKIRVVNNS